jgi:hypothetical protein
MDIPGAFRLGESAGCAERVEGMLEVPPGLVAEGYLPLPDEIRRSR